MKKIVIFALSGFIFLSACKSAKIPVTKLAEQKNLQFFTEDLEKELRGWGVRDSSIQFYISHTIILDKDTNERKITANGEIEKSDSFKRKRIAFQAGDRCSKEGVKIYFLLDAEKIGLPIALNEDGILVVNFNLPGQQSYFRWKGEKYKVSIGKPIPNEDSIMEGIATPLVAITENQGKNCNYKEVEEIIIGKK